MRRRGVSGSALADRSGSDWCRRSPIRACTASSCSSSARLSSSWYWSSRLTTSCWCWWLCSTSCSYWWSCSPDREDLSGNDSCRRDPIPIGTASTSWSCRAGCRAVPVHQRPPRQTRPSVQPPPRSRPRTEVRARCPSSCGPSEHRVLVDPLCGSTATLAAMGRLCDQDHISGERGARSPRPRTSDVWRPSVSMPRRPIVLGSLAFPAWASRRLGWAAERPLAGLHGGRRRV